MGFRGNADGPFSYHKRAPPYIIRRYRVPSGHGPVVRGPASSLTCFCPRPETEPWMAKGNTSMVQPYPRVFGFQSQAFPSGARDVFCSYLSFLLVYGGREGLVFSPKRLNEDKTVRNTKKSPLNRGQTSAEETSKVFKRKSGHGCGSALSDANPGSGAISRSIPEEQIECVGRSGRRRLRTCSGQFAEKRHWFSTQSLRDPLFRNRS